jgi:hypothetical protein
MKRITTVIALWAVFAVSALAQKAGTEQQLAKEANGYFSSGDYLKAYPLYSQLVSLYPQNADYSYRFGACAIYSDPDKSKAIQFLTSASKRNVDDPMLWYYLGKAYHLNYQFREAVAAYEKFVSAADPKVSAKYNAQREIETCIYGSNLLANIKDVVVINKTEADKGSFFRYMNLEGIGGKILTVPVELQSKLDQKSGQPGVIHYPGNSTTIYFSSYGKDGSTGKDIYTAQILADGKYSEPVKVRGDVNTKYDEDFCFLHSDGKTLYFSSKGHNSMGGYDIFRSEMDPKTGEFGPAINMDFAINTPDDDIFYIADSLNQKAYFASGRTSDLNHLHVYNVMVQGIPLQVVYLKGDFVSEIDAEQKQATVQVREELTGRLVIESTTSKSTGAYTVYVPKGGDYIYYVKTENSPVVHEAKVTVPAFDKPVALRQEIRLTKENGKEKLVVNNYFDTPLQEDIAALAAEMLRRKAGLEVSDSPALPVASADGSEQLAVEKTMANAPLAAGFGEGVTVESVISDMDKEVATIRNFVAESDKKYNAAYSYAVKKQKEADEALVKAEQLNSMTSNYTSDEDVLKLRESQEYLVKAQELQREAKAAMIAAESVKQYKDSEAQRGDAIAANLDDLQKAKAADNFDQVLTELKEEKDRIILMREGNGSPLAEITAKARAKESVQHAAEDKLVNLREDEKDAQVRVTKAEQAVASAKKKNDKAAAETELANARAELDAVRRDIVNQKEKVQVLGNETKDAYAGAVMFEKLSTESTLGLKPADIKPMDVMQKDALAMKIEAMETRFEALEITDPQTLALLGAPVEASVAVNRTSTAPENDTTSNTANANSTEVIVENTTSTTPSNNATPPTETNTAANNATENTTTTAENTTQPEENTIPANSTLEIPANSTTAANTTEPEETTIPEEVIVENTTTTTAGAFNPTVSQNPMVMRSNTTAALVVIGAPTPTNAPSRRMVMANTLEQTESRIEAIQLKRMSGISPEEKKELQDLIAYRNELQGQVKSTDKAALPVANKEEARAITNSVEPDYTAELQSIENGLGTEVERTAERVAYQKEVIKALKAERAENANSALTAANASDIAAIAKRDQELESAISFLEKETENLDQFKAAYAEGNKAIIENSASNQARLDDQITLTQGYMNTLESLEAEQQEQLAICTDLKEAEAIRMRIGELKKEYGIAEAKLNSYQSDLQLTASTSEPTSPNTTTSTTTPSQTLEDVVEKEEADRQMGADKIAAKAAEEEALIAKIEEDAEVIKETFKPTVEAESIFAYESGNLEGLYEEHGSSAGTMKETAKIAETSQKILLLEAEIENETNKKKQKRLDRKAEKLYFQRAKMEMVNEPVIKEMTRLEFEQVVAEVDALNTENQEELNSRTMLRDEVRKLYNAAKKEYEDAQALRLQAGPVTDDIEKNDFYRQAFAKEMHAIQMMEQIKKIHGEMDMLLEYDDQELAELRYGNPAEIRERVAAKNATAISSESASPVAENTVSASTPEVASANPNTPANANAPSSAASNAAEANAYYSEADASAYYYEAPAILTKNLYTRASGVYSNARPIPVDGRMPQGTYYAVQIGAFRNAIPQNLYNEFAPIYGQTLNSGITRYTAGFFLTFDNADEVKMEIRRLGYSDAFVVAYRDGKRIPLYEAMGKTETDVQASVEKEYIYGDEGQNPADRKGSTNATQPVANATQPASTVQQPTASTTQPTAANGDYYKAYPNAAPATQVETVKGLFYTVQVGVYSKPVPASNMKNISPLNSELTATQKIRYTSGMYNNLEAAVNQRDAAKTLGIGDAFITAYYNGVRITLSEADRLLKELGPTILVK